MYYFVRGKNTNSLLEMFARIGLELKNCAREFQGVL